jgi:hypothetical protein
VAAADDDAHARPWSARWIWSQAPEMRREGSLLAPRVRREPAWCCLRRSFDLASVPPRAPARLTADSRYVLWLNGVEVMRGPVRANLRRLHHDRADLAPFLRAGRNVVAVLARFFGDPNPWWAPAPPGAQLGAGAFVLEADLGAAGVLISDAAWRALRGDAWRDVAPAGIGALPAECHDARLVAPDWREPGFDDERWPAAVELDARAIGFTGRQSPPSLPYGALPPRPIPPLGDALREPRAARVFLAPRAPQAEHPFDQVRADAQGARPAGDECGLPLELSPSRAEAALVSLDFGEVVCGTVELELEAPAGARVDAAALEFTDADGLPDPDGEHSGFRYVARGVDDRHETLMPLGLRRLVLSVRSDGPVRLARAAVHERLRPRPPGPFFACSDPTLTRIWEVGVRSVDLNAQDTYTDCPTREQRGWTGDLVVHQMVDLVANPDPSLARWAVEMAASPRADGMLPMAAGGDVEHGDVIFIPDWALHWVRALHNLFRFTGDRERVARLLPVAENVLRWFEPFRDVYGVLAQVTGWVIIDWSSVTTEGASSVLNALWARGLRDFAEMAEWLGDAGRAAWARARHAELAAAFELFWDAERELYVDHAVGGDRGRPLSQHAQAAALAAGIVPRARVAGVLEAMLDRSRLVHAAWSVPDGDARRPPGGGRARIGGAYLVAGPPAPWWDVERQLVAAQPFFRYVVHDAVAEAGRPDLIAGLCRDWEALLVRCPTSWSETWFGGTVSHGWSSTPTRDLSTHVLGVAPIEPGFARARIAPRLGGLAWARGALPTPRGLLTVEASRERVVVDSPVPFVLDLGRGPSSKHSPGRHGLPGVPG